MTRGIVFGVTVLGLAACSSSSPQRSEVSAPAPTGNVATKVSEQTAAIGADTEAEAPAAKESALHVVEVPTVAKTSYSPPRASEPHQSEMICRREKTTGSHRITKVCRTRKQIDIEMEAAQDMVQGMSRQAR